MDGDPEFLINPLSYALGGISLIGFFIVALIEGKQWIQRLLGRKDQGKVRLLVDKPAQVKTQAADQPSTIMGLIFLGVLFSAVIFVANEKVERMNDNISLFEYMLILFLYIMLPGILAGIATGIWIKASRQNHSCDLLSSLMIGMLAYISLIALVGFTDLDPLLFACGPAVTLLIYRYSESRVA